MTDTASPILKKLNDTLKKTVIEIGLEEVETDEKELKIFCDIIDDNYLKYLNSNTFPPGYIMNLTNSVIRKVFIKLGPIIMSKIQALIHVSSEVKYLKPMSMNEKYKIKIETSEPIEKKGKTGTYYSVIFKTLIFDDKDLCATDDHNFFFKL